MFNYNVKKIGASVKNLKLKQACLILFGAINSALAVLFALSAQLVLQAFTLDGFCVSKSAAVLICASLIIAVFCLTAFTNFLSEKFKIDAEISVKKDVLKGYLSLNYYKASEISSGDVITKIQTDCANFAVLYVAIIPQIVNIIVKVAIIAAALSLLNLTFTAVLVASGIFLVAMTYLVRKITIKLFKKTRESDAKTTTAINQTANNLSTVKAMNKEDEALLMLSNKLENYRFARKKQRYFQAGFSSVNALIFDVVYILAIIISLVASAPSSAETFASFTLVSILQLLMQARTPVTSFGPALNNYYEMTAAADRIVEITGGEVVKTNLSGNFKSVDVKSLSFSYGDKQVVNNLNFTVAATEKVLIKGKTGVGKSTILKLIAGLYEPSDGSVEITTGETAVNACDARGIYSVVFQGNGLFDGTLKYNLTFANEETTDDEISAAVKFACLDDVLTSVGGLDGYVGENGCNLSEGQAQRVALARAYLSKNQVLLLDEPTSALDAKTEIKVFENVKNLNKTVIMVSHSDVAANYVDKIIEIK